MDIFVTTEHHIHLFDFQRNNMIFSLVILKLLLFLSECKNVIFWWNCMIFSHFLYVVVWFMADWQVFILKTIWLGYTEVLIWISEKCLFHS